MRTMNRDQEKTREVEELPPFSREVYRWFMWYVRRYLRRHFHAVRLLRGADGGSDRPEIGGEPVVFYSNHPGWWDPLTFLFVGEALYPGRMVYGPIDASALGKYKFLERIGFLGIDPHTWRGSARFLRMARAAARRTDVIFWITAQGEFADPRVRLAAFGPALRVADFHGRPADEWTAALAAGLEAVQDRLAAATLDRDPTAFTTLLSGRVGVGPAYDTIRRVKAWLRGERFDASHGGPQGGGAR
jgi:hypothetical protein